MFTQTTLRPTLPLLGLLAGLLFSLNLHAASELGSGTLLLPVEGGGEPVAAPLLATEVSMQVVAMTARVTVSQRFRNPGARWTEGVYVFPLPDEAAVDQLRMVVGERIIVGEIKERDQARKVYEQARDAGQRSSLVEQQRPNIFTTSVANIEPGGEIRIDIEYQQPVRYRDGVFSLRFPMVVAPRYIPGTPIKEQIRLSGGWAADTDQVPDAAKITPPVQKPDRPDINPVSLKLRLDAGMPLAEISSRYHPIRIEQRGQQYHIELAQGSTPANRDFELVWTPEPGQAPQAALFTEQQDGQHYALLMLSPPDADSLSELALPRDLTFIIDTSGSMFGDSMNQAREALLLALQGLNDRDRFNIIEFNSTATRLFPALTQADSAHRQRAANWVRGLRADGGTEMAAALQLALPEDPQQGDRLHQIIFLTDGAVGNETALFQLIEQRLGSSRLFPVGIGSAPNSYFMRKAAHFGRGNFTHIGKSNEILEKMSRLLERLRYPALTDLQLILPGNADTSSEADIYPNPLPDLYLGEPLQLALRLPQLPPQLTIKGRFGNRPWQADLQLDSPLPGDGIRVLWARRRIDTLMDQHRLSRDASQQAQLREAVLKTALDHHLVSQFTSLVAVDKTPARPANETLNAKQIPLNLPKGWSYGKVFGMANTATPGPLLLLGGLSLLLAAGALRKLGHRHGLQP